MKFFIPIVFLLSQLAVIAQVDSVNSIKVRKLPVDTIYTWVDEMPQFPGGDAAFMRYFITVAYPDSAKENEIEGRVHVRMVIDETGAVMDVEIVKSAAPILDQAVIDHVREMPLWTPGRQQGVPVKVQYIVPVNFTLQ